MSWFRRRPPERPMEDLRIENEMVDHGWRFWTASTTTNEKLALIDRYRAGERLEWYPPDDAVVDTSDVPVDYSGEKIVE